ESWSLKGEMALSRSCTVFCPCVLSLGEHPPTESRCLTWSGIRIDEGHFDNIDLSGIKVGLMMDLPGVMARGNWTAALFVDEKASAYAVKGLTRIFTGRVGGSTHLYQFWSVNFSAYGRCRSPMRPRGKRVSCVSRNTSTGRSRQFRARSRGRTSRSA